MAKTVWRRKEDLVAFGHGRDAALQGRPRVAMRTYPSYDERAAFNDGWDSVMKIRATPPRGKRRPPPPLSFD